MDAIFDPKIKCINGPVGIIRLEGNVYGIKKVIYLFMDIHMRINKQTQCDNIYSKNIQQFFAEEFLKLNNENKTYDFFVEIFTHEISEKKKKDNVSIYINEVVDLFEKVFSFDYQKNKIKKNKVFRNIRLHYMDTRDYLEYPVDKHLTHIIHLINDSLRKKNLSKATVSNIHALFGKINDYLTEFTNVLQQKQTNIKKIKILQKTDYHTVNKDVINYLIHKLKTKYNNPDVNKKMNELIKSSSASFNSIIKAIDSLRKYIEDYSLLSKTQSDKMLFLKKINNYIKKYLNLGLIEVFARFIDIFFLRRFLDKDYITNAIVYTGMAHSSFYIHYLINHYNFRITHISNTNIKPETLTKKIRNKTYDETDYILHEIIDPKQCSEITNFPDNFK